MKKKILQKLLKFFAILALKKYQPKIVAITGSVGKTSTKEAIAILLAKKFRIFKTIRNYNNEIGVPLAILGQLEAQSSLGGWFFNFLKIIKLVVFCPDYPKILILEFGADRPGDIAYLTKFVKPDVAVVTAVGEIPVHVEFYAGPKEVAKEKEDLVKALSPQGWAVLNYDDLTVLTMREGKNIHSITFGFNENADVFATEVKIVQKEIGQRPLTIFNLHLQDQVFTIETRAIGKGAIYAMLAASACGLILGLDKKTIVQAVAEFHNQPGRLNILEGIKNSLIIDDSYNAAPLSMHAALDLLKQLKGKRKIAVLGDMRELGEYSLQAHLAIADLVVNVCDILITVGKKGKIIGQHAKELGLKEVYNYLQSKEVGKKLSKIIRPGDLTLVKGSRAMAMENIVLEIMAEPEKASEFLVH